MNNWESCGAHLIADVLKNRAVSTPERMAFTFANEQTDGTLQEETRTFRALDERVEILAAKLARPDLFQERAILFFQPGLAYIETFFACLRAGVIAVPAYPPRSAKTNQRNLERLRTMLADARPRLALTTQVLYERMAHLREHPALAQLEWLVVDDPASLKASKSFALPETNTEHLAFLQYTSGSTSTPKGVIITQGNLMANEAMIQEAFATSPESTCVGWLPLYHDMGLIGNILQPIFAGFTCHLMAPTTFLRRPILWLEAIERHRAHISGGPNFAYELCVQKITGDLNLDLSSWRVAFNGSEPIRAETLDQFAARFAPHGFQRSAFFPCYGLAESTLMISGKSTPSPRVAYFDEIQLSQNQVRTTEADAGRSAAHVGSGTLCTAQQVRIVSPETLQTLGRDQVGEIWAAGPHIAAGYWQQPELSRETFEAYTSDTGEGPFMRTGDLGFFHGDELFITGRLKELIILRGRNVYPQDIERTVSCSHEALPPDSGAAFSVERDGQQQLVVVQEVARTQLRNLDPSEVIEAIQSAVSQVHELALHAVVLIRPASLPKTTSGKIRRNHTRQMFLEGALAELGASRRLPQSVVDIVIPSRADATHPEEQERAYLTYLQAVLARALELPLEEIEPDRAITSMGLDSLASIGLVQTLRENLGVDYPLEHLLEGPTPQEIASWLAEAPNVESSLDEEIDEGACSINQSALWLLHELNPASAAYHIPVAVGLRQPLDVSKFKQALAVLCRRHPSLRTRFVSRKGEPRLEVLDHVEAPLQVIDAQHWDAQRLHKQVRADAKQPMNLSELPWRIIWFDRGPEGGVLLLVSHHTIADMWSTLLFFSELGTFYGDPQSAIAAPKYSYAHFTARWKARLEGPRGEALWRFWREQMTPLPQTLVLPTDRPRPTLQTNAGAGYDFALGPVSANRIRAFAAENGTTPFAVLLTVWQVLLHRYSGQDDICVGSPTAGRLDGDFRDVLGDFVNPVVFRGDHAGNPSFRDLMKQTANVVRSGLAHQEYPFELLVEKICPRRDPSFSPVFQAMFSLQKPQGMPDAAAFILGDRDAALTLGGLTLTPYPLPVEASQVDMALVVVDDNRLPARIVYNTDLFDEATARQTANHFNNLMRGFLENPGRRIDTLELFTQKERDYLLNAFNSTEAPFEQRPLHQLFEASVARSGENTALIYGVAGDSDHRLSYNALNQRANRLAFQLRARGIGADQRVGICLNRRPDLVVALLAVLKAGAAYVPLDPTHPRARTNQILHDAGINLLITEEDLKASLPGEVATLTPAGFARTTPDHNLNIPVWMNQLAYVIYTSGSTGRPKGVQLTHHSVVNFLTSMAAKPGLDETDTLLALTTVSFDIAGLELYLPLLNGARLVLAANEEVTDGAALLANISRNKVTVMQATPSSWRLVLEAGFRGNLRALCGGEALPGALARDLLAAGVDLYNMYGPTETTIWSAVRAVPQAAPQTEPVGGPIANTRLHVVDQHCNLQPFGVPGQLLIGGDGLARGYLNRPGLTASAFIPDPFGTPGARLYKTGDLVGQRPNGDIDFLGRLDFQVKLHGFRIEIGEIEASLNRHPDVAEGVVGLRGNSETDRRLIAWMTLVPGSGLEDLKAEQVAFNRALRTHLSKDIPDYMVPTAFAVLDQLPLTPNNKVDRKALPEPRLKKTATIPMPTGGIEALITEVWREFLDTDRIGPNDSFFDLGGNSMMLSRVNNRLKERLDQPITMVELFQFPTISSLAAHLRENGSAPKAEAQKTVIDPKTPIAIIGMSCRFPGAADVDTFWRNLREGRSALGTYSDEDLLKNGVRADLLDHPNYVRTGGFLDEADGFDAQFFDFSPLDAGLIDPQQRVFLEVCWHALENGGYNPDDYAGAIGVFAGSGMNTYLSNNLLTQPGLMETEGEYRIMTTNDKDFLATRVAYKLNLRGPAINVQTACSTSLVAVHEACNSLRTGESDMALAGGATIRVPLHVGYLYRDGLVFSPDGLCRAFDKDAGGTVPGSGAGAVLLKRLDDAVRDGDDIVAVIKGSAVNNDAAQKVGYTAPGVEGQRKAILAAQAAAGVDPETITYVEAHGTATKMGDPIEIAALTAAFRTGTDKSGFCALGSVKTNIGHLDTAAGVAGLIKTALALKHGYLPASLNYREPNPEIGFPHTPFFVNAEGRAWTTALDVPRRAAVSSFGIGGTNAHAVLEEAPSPGDRPGIRQQKDDFQLLLFSTRSANALDALTSDLAAFLEQPDQKPLAEIAAQLATTRKRFEHRRFVVCAHNGDGAEALKTVDPKRVFSRRDDQVDCGVVFMFPGQGAQFPGMSQALYDNEPIFREVVDHCSRILAPKLDCDLRDLLYPKPELSAWAADQLRRTQFTQPALFVVEYALAMLMMDWGLKPRALVGHSVGEYVAATLAGVFKLEDALALVAERGRLIASLPGGAMLSVALSEEALKPYLNEELSLAAVNAPDLCVLSGSHQAVEALAARLELGGTDTRRLQTSHAFHSHMMDPILEPFASLVDGVDKAAPQLPIISNLTGQWLSAEQATDPAYWTRHLRGAVRFADGLDTLFQDAETVFLEMGPGRALSSLARRHPKRGGTRTLLNLLPTADQLARERVFFLEAVGKLWLTGVKLDWRRYHPGNHRRLKLPRYPFQRERFWIEPGEGVTKKPANKSKDVADWFYMPSWKRTAPPAAVEKESAQWLVFSENQGPGAAFAQWLEHKGHNVVRVSRGNRFIRVGEDRYTLEPTKQEEYAELITVLSGSGRMPEVIVHFGNMEASPHLSPLQSAFYEPLYLARALTDQEGDVQLVFASEGMQDVAGEGPAEPHKAMINGILKVIPQEHKHIICRSVDFAAGDDQTRAQQLYRELCGREEAQVAWRGRHRWLPYHEHVRLPEPNQHPLLREAGCYLITGGLGGIGLAIAEHLAQTYKARLVLLGRSAPQQQDVWPAHLTRLEAGGAKILPIRADVTNADTMDAAVREARKTFGRIDGVIHAAGLPGGGALAHREREQMEAVFAPKVQGTLNLERALADDPPEFFCLFSSINAVIGGFGQADYAAANAFLDAFAYARQDGPSRVFSINWDSWHSVGMAVAALEQAAGKVKLAPLEGAPCAYPLFEVKQAEENNRVSYLGHLDVTRHWPLNQHWILDRAILPGTTYLEMARAALEDHAGWPKVTFRDVAFLAPLIVPQGQQGRFRVVLERKGPFFQFTVSSLQDGGVWRDHAGGELHPVDESPGTHNLADLFAAHQGRIVEEPLQQDRLDAFHIKAGDRDLGDHGRVDLRVVTDGKEPPEVSIELGRRWDCARRVLLGEESGLAEMALDPAFAPDFDHYKLHPAMLDFAVGYLRLFKNQAQFLPLSYERLTLFQPLPAKFLSYIRFADAYQADRGNPIFDVFLLDSEGRELVRIEGFALGRMDGARLEADEKAGREKAAEMAAFTRNWLSPAEGIEAFSRIMAGDIPQVVVSTRDLEGRLEESRNGGEGSGSLHGTGAGFSRPVHPRPDLMNPFVAPRDQHEEDIAGIWAEVIGLDKVGIHDDFNDLGGDSLLITRIHARMKEKFQTEISVAELMQYPNIADISAYMRKQGQSSPDAAKQQEGQRRARQSQSRKGQNRMKKARKRNPLSRSGT